jgi:hypothetical protein
MNTSITLRRQDVAQESQELVFNLIEKSLMQGDRVKSGIKNYRSDHHEFRDFW